MIWLNWFLLHIIYFFRVEPPWGIPKKYFSAADTLFYIEHHIRYLRIQYWDLKGGFAHPLGVFLHYFSFFHCILSKIISVVPTLSILHQQTLIHRYLFILNKKINFSLKTFPVFFISRSRFRAVVESCYLLPLLSRVKFLFC